MSAQAHPRAELTGFNSKLDLLVRVRYSNPLPPPPFPPKLINIPTHPSRYARFDYTSKLADETPFPMIVDAELGMPIDLSKFDELWDFDDTTTLGLFHMYCEPWMMLSTYLLRRADGSPRPGPKRCLLSI